MANFDVKRRPSQAGQVLKEYRKSNSITQSQLAQELGVEPRTLRMYESGERALENIIELQRIADLLAIPPEKLGLAAERPIPFTFERMTEVIERAVSLVPQARFLEARTLIEALLRDAAGQITKEDVLFLRPLAQAHYVAGHIQAITCRTYQVEQVIAHFKEMEQLARILGDQTLLCIALSYHGDMLRRRGEMTQGIAYLEAACQDATHVETAVHGNNAQLLGRAYLGIGDLAGFEREMAHAEELAFILTSEPTPSDTYKPFGLGTVYEEYGRSYARLGKMEKSLHYLDRAEATLPASHRWKMVLMASRAEAFIHGGDITNGMPLAVESANLAQIHGHSRLLERFYRLQRYLDEQASAMRRANVVLGDALHGPLER